MNTLRTVGFIGLGTMGGAMARRLAGHVEELVLFDTDEEKKRVVADAAAEGARERENGAGGTSGVVRTAASAAELVRRAETVCLSLPHPPVVVSVAESELIPNAASGRLFVDFSTARPSDTRRVAQRVHETGAAWVDAPVSGGAGGAADGTLRIFVGGEEADYRRARPLLELLGEEERIVHCGPSGNGQVMKAVNQMMMGLPVAALLEALAFGVRGGLSPEAIIAALGDSSGMRGELAQLAGRVAEGSAEDIGTKIGQMADFLAEAEKMGLELPMARAATEFCRDADAVTMEANRRSPSYWRELAQ
jgi:3-hydroxyisobutyrate dehydrogenase